MARIFDEKLEGAGYEEAGADETVGVGCTIDEDANTADAGSPSNWASQCLKLISLSGVANSVEWYNIGPQAISFFRLEKVITAESLGNDSYMQLMHVFADDWSACFVISLFQDGSGNLKLEFKSYHDGNSNNYTGFPTLALNTRYRIEVKWDATNDKWAWKIDGVAQPNDQDDTDPVTSEGNLAATHPTNCDNIKIGGLSDANTTIYYDLIAIDDADWVGAEGGISIPIVMQQMDQFNGGQV